MPLKYGNSYNNASRYDGKIAAPHPKAGPRIHREPNVIRGRPAAICNEKNRTKYVCYDDGEPGGVPRYSGRDHGATCRPGSGSEGGGQPEAGVVYPRPCLELGFGRV
jgi:hypothetical protein